MSVVRTIGLFVIAGLAEIGGAYLIWQWLRAKKPVTWGLLGIGALFIYGVTQTLQTFSFGRAFAGYGGVFITLAMLWDWKLNGSVPDQWDWIGIGICLSGAAVILWMPRG